MWIKVDVDVFGELLWDRVRDFSPCEKYDYDFWEETIEFLKETGFMEKPEQNDPKYIIDNIAVNGEILDEEELKANGHLKEDETIDDYDGDGMRIGNYIVFNLGL